MHTFWTTDSVADPLFSEYSPFSLINYAYSQTLIVISPSVFFKNEFKVWRRKHDIFHLVGFFFFFFLPLFHLHLLAGHDLSIVLSFSLSTHSCFASLSFCFLTTSLVIYIFFILFLAFYFLVSVSFNCPFQWKLSSNTLLYFFVYFKLNSNDPPK